MAQIKYIGTAHFRELLVEDFKKVGVEVDSMISFARHEVVKVTDEVADAIHKLVGDEFEGVKDDVDEELVRDASETPVADTSVAPAVVEPEQAQVPNVEPEPSASA
jgi:hypothetical protein